MLILIFLFSQGSIKKGEKRHGRRARHAYCLPWLFACYTRVIIRYTYFCFPFQKEPQGVALHSNRIKKKWWGDIFNIFFFFFFFEAWWFYITTSFDELTIVLTPAFIRNLTFTIELLPSYHNTESSVRKPIHSDTPSGWAISDKDFPDHHLMAALFEADQP